MLLTYFLFVVAAILCLYAFVYIRAYANPLKRIPGRPLTSPLFGDFITYMQNDCRLFELCKCDAVKYGPIRISHLFFGKYRLNICDPTWIKHVLTTNSKNYKRGDFAGMENLFLAVGQNGLIVVNGDVHKKLRKLASPSFKLSSLKKLMPIVELCGQRMARLFSMRCKEAENPEAEIAVKEILNKTTLDIIGLIAFGHDFKESCSFDTNTFGCDMREWLDKGMELSVFSVLPFQLATKRFLVNLTRYLPQSMLNGVLKLAHTTNKIHDLVEDFVQSKIEERRRGNRPVDNGTNILSSKSLLDFLLDATDSVDVNNAEIHDLIMTFLIAGHETSTLAVTWTLYLLAGHPEYQDECRREVRKFFSEHSNNVEWDDVKKLTLLNAVVHESLRLYPPVPWLHRVSMNADEIGGYYVPPNSDVIILMCDMQRNGDYWPNPNEFVPERFLELHDTIPWHAFMPFGEGAHKCIGYQLALVEIVYLLSILLKNFNFSLDPDAEYHEFVIITAQPKPGLKLRMKML